MLRGTWWFHPRGWGWISQRQIYKKTAVTHVHHSRNLWLFAHTFSAKSAPPIIYRRCPLWKQRGKYRKTKRKVGNFQTCTLWKSEKNILIMTKKSGDFFQIFLLDSWKETFHIRKVHFWKYWRLLSTYQKCTPGTSSVMLLFYASLHKKPPRPGMSHGGDLSLMTETFDEKPRQRHRISQRV